MPDRPSQNAPTRVLQLCEFEREHGGSFIAMLIAVLEAARDRGFAPGAVFFDSVAGHGWLREFERSGIPVHLAPATARDSRAALRKWLEAELGGERAILHTHFTRWDLPAAAYARRSAQTRVVWHVHSTMPRTPLVVARTMLKFAGFGRAVDAFFCPAPNIVEAVRRRGAPARRVHLIPSAVDVEHFAPPTPEQRAGARSALGLEPDELAILHFGWHTHLKGTDLFVEALGQAAERLERPLVGLERGGGAEAQRLAARLGAADLLRVVEPVDDVRILHGAADLLVQSSREEGMAYAVLEALACATPAVVTRIPGHALIGDRVAGCRVVGVDAGEIAAGIVAMLTRDPGAAAEAARETRAWVVETLSTAAIGRQVADLYADLERHGG